MSSPFHYPITLFGIPESLSVHRVLISLLSEDVRLLPDMFSVPPQGFSGLSYVGRLLIKCHPAGRLEQSTRAAYFKETASFSKEGP